MSNSITKIILIAFVALLIILGGVFFWNNNETSVTESPEGPDSGLPPVTAECGIENCHGMDIVCGPKPAEVCDMMYQLGDKCRQFAQCGVVDGVCQKIDNPGFATCKMCVENCEILHPDAPDQALACESACGG